MAPTRLGPPNLSAERTITLQSRPVDLEKIRTLRNMSIFLIGVSAGLLSGLLGIGGGIVLVPAMVYLLGMNQHRAHGTSLATVMPVVLFNAIRYFRGLNGEADWLITAIELAIGGIVGAAIGAKVCNVSSAGQLKKCFGAFLIFVAVRMLLDAANYFAGGTLNLPTLQLPTEGSAGLFVVLAIGTAAGFVSGLLGIGGGVVLVPAMVLLLALAQKTAQAISLAVIVPVSISGSIIHFTHGNIRFDIWKWLTIGGIAGGIAGTELAFSLDPMLLRGIFGLLLLILSILMLRPKRRSTEPCAPEALPPTDVLESG